MYFWNTKNLAVEIKENKLSENAKKNYYFASSVILIISLFLLRVLPETMVGIQYGIVFTEILITIFIYYFGIKITYASNKGDSGVGYIEKSIILTLPLTIKVCLISFIIGVVVAVVAQITGSILIKSILYSVANILTQIWYFWRLNVFMKFVNN